MPFTKVGQDDYTSPSGRHFTTAQVRLWHANGNKFPGQKHSEAPMPKSDGGKVASYAQGGPVLGRTKDFVKEPNRSEDTRFGKFLSTEDDFRDTPNPPADGTDECFGKSGAGSGKGDVSAPAAKGKGLKLPK